MLFVQAALAIAPKIRADTSWVESHTNEITFVSACTWVASHVLLTMFYNCGMLNKLTCQDWADVLNRAGQNSHEEQAHNAIYDIKDGYHTWQGAACKASASKSRLS